MDTDRDRTYRAELEEAWQEFLQALRSLDQVHGNRARARRARELRAALTYSMDSTYRAWFGAAGVDA